MMWKISKNLFVLSCVLISQQVYAEQGQLLSDTTCACQSLKCPTGQAPEDSACITTDETGTGFSSIGCISTTFQGSMLRCIAGTTPKSLECVDIKSAPAIASCSTGTTPEVQGAIFTAADGSAKVSCHLSFGAKDLTCSSGSTKGQACSTEDVQGLVSFTCPKGLQPNNNNCISGEKAIRGKVC